jgi:hypothetical protein
MKPRQRIDAEWLQEIDQDRNIGSLTRSIARLESLKFARSLSASWQLGCFRHDFHRSSDWMSLNPSESYLELVETKLEI